MPGSQLLRPAFTVVLSLDGNSTVLRDYQQALSREIQIPIFGRRNDGLVDTTDTQTPIGYAIYKTEYAREQDAVTVFGDGVAVEAVGEGLFWHRLKTMFNKFKSFGRK